MIKDFINLHNIFIMKHEFLPAGMIWIHAGVFWATSGHRQVHCEAPMAMKNFCHSYAFFWQE